MINKKIRYQEELTDIDCNVIECRHKAQYCVHFAQLNLTIISKINIDGYVKLCPTHYEEHVSNQILKQDKLIFLGLDGEVFKCSRCGYEWMTYYYGNRIPKSCRKCKSQAWKSPYKRRDQVQIIRRVLENNKKEGNRT